MIAALGLMVWSGFKEYQRRKQQAALLRAPQVVLVPDGQAPPTASPDDGATPKRTATPEGQSGPSIHPC